jgi:release factor glutamine methyltransferase
MEKAFYKEIELDVFDEIYEPREDSFLLADSLTNLQGKEVLEIGSGSGIQSIVAAKQGAIVTAVDVNSLAVKCTKHNAEKNNVKITAYQSDLFSHVKEKFDVIIFNPPYLPGRSNDITVDGGKNGIEVIEKFLEQVKDHLTDKGYILLLISSLNNFDLGETVALHHVFFEDMIVKKIEKCEL